MKFRWNLKNSENFHFLHFFCIFYVFCIFSRIRIQSPSWGFPGANRLTICRRALNYVIKLKFRWNLKKSEKFLFFTFFIFFCIFAEISTTIAFMRLPRRKQVDDLSPGPKFYIEVTKTRIAQKFSISFCSNYFSALENYIAELLKLVLGSDYGIKIEI